ncbi:MULTISPECIES: gluconokinase [Cryobacterium]|uniref:Gluconokinase n=1 Tax=Cryobacterium glucosi TaxID=1259175 RepID=A0ABY2ITE9_9MICO|nr:MULTISPECIES: gluconokinase [Cryobacterium]MDY7529723.1 gluconokinase [Cryobacterium sp. 10C2]MDY7558149.1 gluconokinase [Cryobacterium sp. 10C3]MEB0001830.1 gluconokinase [Cryobacterium sp. RTC2.1]MEB0202060.1 gluconokinase [Cryobacterium sp. 5I3]MEB0286034.1 gluconokinase [Cryobacterium sp. 10S3]
MINSVQHPLVVVMGVCGAGKSTVGEQLSRAIGESFIDSDVLHPAANIAKMAAGRPLDDADRMPWLSLVGGALSAARADGQGLVIACSALKRSYRDAIRAEAPGTYFVHLSGTPELLAARLRDRGGHFMPPELLESQLRTLEPLCDTEEGTVVDIAAGVSEIVAAAVTSLRVPAVSQ